MSELELLKIALYLKIYDIFLNFLFLALLGAGIYAFRNRIKAMVKDIVREAIEEELKTYNNRKE